jgi:hypothetical protein
VHEGNSRGKHEWKATASETYFSLAWNYQKSVNGQIGAEPNVEIVNGSGGMFILRQPTHWVVAIDVKPVPVCRTVPSAHK